MARTDLGRVAVRHRGAYSALAVYEKMDEVQFEGSSYRAIEDTTGSPPTNTAYWVLVSAKGADGGPGSPGADGRDGVDGGPGPQGPPGTGLEILALYPTLAALQAAHPIGNTGDVYAVGTEASSVIYIWDVDAGAWKNMGALQGPEGQAATLEITQTITGAPGTQASVTEDVGSTAQARRYIVTVPQGGKGDKGDKGDTGETGSTGPEGPQGIPGYGIPTGGDVGQVIAKNSAADYDVSYKTLTASDVGAVASGDRLALCAPIVEVTAGRTLALTDLGCVINVTSADPVTLTIPADADVNMPDTTELEVWQSGAGAVTIAAAAGVTIESYEGLTSTAGQYAAVALKKRAANTWRLAGNLA